jgi:hypothetical protein
MFCSNNKTIYGRCAAAAIHLCAHFYRRFLHHKTLKISIKKAKNGSFTKRAHPDFWQDEGSGDN